MKGTLQVKHAEHIYIYRRTAVHLHHYMCNKQFRYIKLHGIDALGTSVALFGRVHTHKRTEEPSYITLACICIRTYTNNEQLLVSFCPWSSCFGQKEGTWNAWPSVCNTGCRGGREAGNVPHGVRGGQVPRRGTWYLHAPPD